MIDVSEIGLLKACETLHMVTTGANPDIPLEEALYVAKQIEARVLGWQPSLKGFASYDASVCALCEVALEDFYLRFADEIEPTGGDDALLA